MTVVRNIFEPTPRELQTHALKRFTPNDYSNNERNLIFMTPKNLLENSTLYITLHHWNSGHGINQSPTSDPHMHFPQLSLPTLALFMVNQRRTRQGFGDRARSTDPLTRGRTTVRAHKGALSQWVRRQRRAAWVFGVVVVYNTSVLRNQEKGL